MGAPFYQTDPHKGKFFQDFLYSKRRLGVYFYTTGGIYDSPAGTNQTDPIEVRVSGSPIGNIAAMFPIGRGVTAYCSCVQPFFR